MIHGQPEQKRDREMNHIKLAIGPTITWSCNGALKQSGFAQVMNLACTGDYLLIDPE